MQRVFSKEQPLSLTEKIINFGKETLKDESKNELVRKYDIFSEIILNKNIYVFDNPELLKNYPHGIITKDIILIPENIINQDELTLDVFLMNAAIKSITLQTDKVFDDKLLTNLISYYKIPQTIEIPNISMLDKNELKHELEKSKIYPDSIDYFINQKDTLSEELFNKILETNKEIKSENHPLFNIKDLKSNKMKDDNNIIIEIIEEVKNSYNKSNKNSEKIIDTISTNLLDKICSLNSQFFFYAIENIRDELENINTNDYLKKVFIQKLVHKITDYKKKDKDKDITIHEETKIILLKTITGYSTLTNFNFEYSKKANKPR